MEQDGKRFGKKSLTPDVAAFSVFQGILGYIATSRIGVSHICGTKRSRKWGVPVRNHLLQRWFDVPHRNCYPQICPFIEHRILTTKLNVMAIIYIIAAMSSPLPTEVQKMPKNGRQKPWEFYPVATTIPLQQWPGTKTDHLFHHLNQEASGSSLSNIVP